MPCDAQKRKRGAGDTGSETPFLVSGHTSAPRMRALCFRKCGRTGQLQTLVVGGQGSGVLKIQGARCSPGVMGTRWQQHEPWHRPLTCTGQQGQPTASLSEVHQVPHQSDWLHQGSRAAPGSVAATTSSSLPLPPQAVPQRLTSLRFARENLRRPKFPQTYKQ